MSINEMIRALETAREIVGGDALICARRFNHDYDETITINMTVDNLAVEDKFVTIKCTDY